MPKMPPASDTIQHPKTSQQKKKKFCWESMPGRRVRLDTRLGIEKKKRKKKIQKKTIGIKRIKSTQRPAARRPNTKGMTLSGEGFPTKGPNGWGPKLWFVLHTISANFPMHPTPAQRQEYMAFFSTLKFVLPCRACREGYTAIVSGPNPALRLRPAVFRNRLTLFAWLVRVHDAVSAKLRTQSKRKTVAQWYAHYDAFRAKPKRA